MPGPLHEPAPHESGALHVTGGAAYTDDLDVAEQNAERIIYF